MKEFTQAIQTGQVSKDELDAALKALRQGADQNGRMIWFSKFDAWKVEIFAKHNQAINMLDEVSCGYESFVNELGLPEE